MDFNGLPVVTKHSEQRLNKKQLLDYQEHRKAFISWLLAFGKNPKRAAGYSRPTVRRTAYRTDQFNRWVWGQEGTYTTNISHDHADDYMKELAYSEQSNAHKSNTQKSIKRFCKWLAHERGGKEWETDYSFSTSGTANPRDYLTVET